MKADRFGGANRIGRTDGAGEGTGFCRSVRQQKVNRTISDAQGSSATPIIEHLSKVLLSPVKIGAALEQVVYLTALVSWR